MPRKSKLVWDDLIGKTFGRLTIIKKIDNKECECRCICGNKTTNNIYKILSGWTTSCGCAHIKHGFSKTRFYKIWKNVQTKTNNPKTPYFRYYGGRGIKCEWKCFDQFHKDMYQSYLRHSLAYTEKNTTIDRINTNGNYSRSNCRWATREVQSNNTRHCDYLTFKGRTQTRKAWARELGFSSSCLAKRSSLGWSVVKMLSTPINTIQGNQFGSKKKN